jgi:hypothetical protein
MAEAAPAALNRPRRSHFGVHSPAVRSVVIGLLVFLNPRRIFQPHLHDSIEDSQAAGGKFTLTKICNRLFLNKYLSEEWKGSE